MSPVALKRNAPEECTVQLGCLRLWRDDLEAIVAMVEQLPDVEITLEANCYTFDDLTTDLAKLGPRIDYFKVTATSTNADAGREILRIQLGGPNTAYHDPNSVEDYAIVADRDSVRATDPDLPTKAVIHDITSFADQHRRKVRTSTTSTILYTGTRAEAPTWWQEYRSHIGIGVVTAAVFYGLGLLTAHL